MENPEASDSIVAKPLQTLGCHLVELNAALNLHPDKRNDPNSEGERAKIAVKTAVLNYIEKRNECLSLAKVA